MSAFAVASKIPRERERCNGQPNGSKNSRHSTRSPGGATTRSKTARMSRKQPTLHEAMQTILLTQPNRTAILQKLSDENIRLDLCRKAKGD
jgi:hypothetical protein